MVNPEKAVLRALISVAHQERPPDVKQRCRGIAFEQCRPRDIAEDDLWGRAGALFCEGLEAAKLAYGDTPKEECLRQYHAAKTAMDCPLERWQD